MSYYDKERYRIQDDFGANSRNFANRDSEQHSPKVQLNASTGGAGPLPIITTLFSEEISIVDVSINTTGMETPVVLLNFSSILSLPHGISVTLNFQINRAFNDGATVKVGSTYTFSTLVEILEAQSFGFQFFDTDLAAGKYTYSVELSTNSIIDITPGLTIVNATLSALAVDNG